MAKPSENMVILTGHLGEDAVVSHTGKGTQVANCFIAVTKQRKDSDEVMWFDIAIFGNVLNAIGHRLKKGVLIYVRGELNKKVWNDLNDGHKNSKIEVVVGDAVPGSRILVLEDKLNKIV